MIYLFYLSSLYYNYTIEVKKCDNDFEKKLPILCDFTLKFEGEILSCASIMLTVVIFYLTIIAFAKNGSVEAGWGQGRGSMPPLCLQFKKWQFKSKRNEKINLNILLIFLCQESYCLFQKINFPFFHVYFLSARDLNYYIKKKWQFLNN